MCAGARIVCSTCGTSLTVPKVEPGARRIEAQPTDEVSRAPAADEADEAQPEAPPLYRLFFPGIHNFSLYRGCRGRIAVLAVWGSLVILALTTSLGLAMRGGGLAGAMGNAMFGICLLAVSTMLGAACIIYASVLAAVIIQDTANGADAIENWPGAVWLDWFPQVFYVLNPLVLTTIPGYAVGTIAGLSGAAFATAVAVSVFLLFPIVSLSMQEADSTIRLFSWPVLRRLSTARLAWLLFYIHTGALLAAAGFLVSLLLSLDQPGITLVGLVVCVSTGAIYFRILGRLAQFLPAR